MDSWRVKNLKIDFGGGGGGNLSKFTGKPIFSVDEVSSLDFDLIFIANAHYNTLKQTIESGVPKEKIVVVFQEVFEKYKAENPEDNIKFAFTSVLTEKIQKQPILGEKVIEIDGNYFLLAEDGFRVGTMQLISDEIRNRNITGEIAELGVFRGDFAQYLNQLFPDRC